MASPEVEPPMTSCQCSTGNWLASRMPRRAQRSSKDFEEVGPSLSREVRLSRRISGRTCWSAAPLDPPASRAAGRRAQARRRCARGGAAPPPPDSPARCGPTMPAGWGDGVRRTPRRRRVAAPRQEPHDSP